MIFVRNIVFIDDVLVVSILVVIVVVVVVVVFVGHRATGGEHRSWDRPDSLRGAWAWNAALTTRIRHFTSSELVPN